jgi:hypothetical protein
MNLRDALFADQDLGEVLLAAELPPGSPLAAARARLWEADPAATARLADGAPEPWRTFLVAAARLEAGLDAAAVLAPLAQNPRCETRARLWAWTALRGTGALSPPPSEVLGLVVEVPVESGYDVLAAYADGRVRFLGHRGQVIIREPPERADPTVTALLREAASLLDLPAAPRDRDVPAPLDGVRLSALSSGGVHTGWVSWADLDPPAPHAALFAAATRLLEAITALAP